MIEFCRHFIMLKKILNTMETGHDFQIHKG